jgi:hypothetical protein
MSEKLRARVLVWLKTEFGSVPVLDMSRWENLFPEIFLNLSFWGLTLGSLSGIFASFERILAFRCVGSLPTF